MTQKPRKGDFRELKSQKFPYGACSRFPLEARKSVSTYPRSALAHEIIQLKKSLKEATCSVYKTAKHSTQYLSITYFLINQK